jgi:hypothetical protein
MRTNVLFLLQSRLISADPIDAGRDVARAKTRVLTGVWASTTGQTATIHTRAVAGSKPAAPIV